MYHFTIMLYDEPQLFVEYDDLNASSRWLTDKRHPLIPFNMYPDKITLDAISDFCESRLEPRTRVNIKEILRRKYKLLDYFPIAMCRKFNGATFTDHIWLKFENDEGLRWKDVNPKVETPKE